MYLEQQPLPGYGLFWFGVGTTWMIQMGAFGENLLANADSKQLGVAFIGYLIFTLFDDDGWCNGNS